MRDVIIVKNGKYVIVFILESNTKPQYEAT